MVERGRRTFGESLEEETLTSLFQARDIVDKTIRWYNQERLHSALGFLRPVGYYRGHPEALHAERRRKPDTGAEKAIYNYGAARCRSRTGKGSLLNFARICPRCTEIFSGCIYFTIPMASRYDLVRHCRKTGRQREKSMERLP